MKTKFKSRLCVKPKPVTYKAEYIKMSTESIRENVRLKNKIHALQKEIAENNESHKRDLAFHKSRLEDMRIQKQEEETYLSCKDFEEIDKLERELIHKTEKIKLTKCVFISIGLIIGVVIGKML